VPRVSVFYFCGGGARIRNGSGISFLRKRSCVYLCSDALRTNKCRTRIERVETHRTIWKSSNVIFARQIVQVERESAAIVSLVENVSALFTLGNDVHSCISSVRETRVPLMVAGRYIYVRLSRNVRVNTTTGKRVSFCRIKTITRVRLPGNSNLSDES